MKIKQDYSLQSHGDNVRAKILDFIRNYMLEHRYPPTLREICSGVGLKSTASTFTHLRKLEEDGLITTRSGEPRTVVPNDIKVVLREES